MLRIFCVLLFGVTGLSGAAQTNGGDSKNDPKDALGWFERAGDQMNLRELGSAPFHMRVKFHAFPGQELLPPEKSEIIIGDGVYEETWISPEQWRREVTLRSYHAVETHNDRERKMRANSDYEPSRVLMLMESLLNPIPRGLLAPELQDRRTPWKLDRSLVGGHSFVRISNSSSISNGITRGAAYVFLPGGLLLQSNLDDIVTTWQNDALFAGKVVPRHISIQAGGERDLLTAEIEVEQPGKLDSVAYDPPGEPADPGMTLRPLHSYEVKPAELTHSESVQMAMQGPYAGHQSSPGVIIHGVVDRHGVFREVEIIYAQGNSGAGPSDGSQPVIDAARQYKFRSAEIDGSPCETVFEIL
jgi:hypothetical protein